MHVKLGGYHIRDVTFSAAFDIDKNKVGKDLAEAIFTKPNNTIKFSNVPKLDVEVQRGMTHDGLGKYLSKVIEKHPSHTVDVSHVLRETNTQVLLNYLPVGSEFPKEAVLVSSSGALAVTWMASEVAPTSSVKSTTRRSWTRTSMPSRTDLRKPAASAVTR